MGWGFRERAISIIMEIHRDGITANGKERKKSE